MKLRAIKKRVKEEYEEKLDLPQVMKRGCVQAGGLEYTYYACFRIFPERVRMVHPWRPKTFHFNPASLDYLRNGPAFLFLPLGSVLTKILFFRFFAKIPAFHRNLRGFNINEYEPQLARKLIVHPAQNRH